MSAKNSASLLLAEIDKTQEFLRRLDHHYHRFLETDFKVLGKKNSSAIVIADVFCNFYTCIETLFLRISQFFENDLRKEQWHKDLLHKMTLEISHLRKRVISEETFEILSEFLKFRHFRRYYFEFEYDWDKIRFLQKKYDQVNPLLKRDLSAFAAFLKELKGLA